MSDECMDRAVIANFSLASSTISGPERTLMMEHFMSCPTCRDQLDHYLRMDFPAPDEGTDEAEDAPAASRPLALAASPERDDPAMMESGAEPLVVLGEVEVYRHHATPTRFRVLGGACRGRTIRILARGYDPIVCEVDSFGRFDLSEAEARRLVAWVERGVELALAVA